MNEAKLWFWIFMDALIVVLVVVIFAVAMPSLARYSGSLVPARTVTVTAEGKTTATPDLAELSFSVVTQGGDPQTLSTNNNTKLNSVMQFLASQNIATSDIQTISYDLEPNYQYNQNGGGNPTIVGYTLTQGVQVKIHDLTQVASVMGGLAPLGVNQIGGVNFTFADQDVYVASARAQAMTKAQQKAEQMAAAAGASLGGVVTMNENSAFPVMQKMYSVSAPMAAVGMNSAVSTPSIQPGSEDITDDVTVTYALY
jgi:uncharacterized protein YggE